MSNRRQELWSVQEVSGYLDMHPETIRQMAREGGLPTFSLNA
jgi:hypothetical protein